MIRLEHINKHYFNNSKTVKQEVLKDVSIEIKPKESVAILGPSGCGKSTLLNMMGTLDKPDTGTVEFDGKMIQELNDKELSEFRNQHIGFIFQMHHLLPQLSVFENVLLPTLAGNSVSNKEELKERALCLLDQLGIKDKAEQFPGQLSGGECQRVAVVRALINQPKLILADEPTGSLDQQSAEQIGKLLAEIQDQQEVALVVVTHSKELAEKMQHQYHLVDGQIKKLN